MLQGLIRSKPLQPMKVTYARMNGFFWGAGLTQFDESVCWKDRCSEFIVFIEHLAERVSDDSALQTSV